MDLLADDVIHRHRGVLWLMPPKQASHQQAYRGLVTWDGEALIQSAFCEQRGISKYNYAEALFLDNDKIRYE